MSLQSTTGTMNPPLSDDTPIPDSGLSTSGRQVYLGDEMQEALRSVAQHRPERKTFPRLLKPIAELVDCERIFLYRFRKAGGFHVLAACNRDGESLTDPDSRMSHYAVKQAMASGERLIVENARVDRRYRSPEALEGKKTAKSIIVLPIRVQGKLYGAIYADHRFQVMSPPPEIEEFRAWISLTELCLSLWEHYRVVRRRRKELESRLYELGAISDPALDLAPARLSNAQAERYLEVSPEVRDFHGFRSANPDLHDMCEGLHSLADAGLPVLISGDTGTGKSLLARAIHEASSRRGSNFITFHCGSVPETLVDSELMGHVKGAFTGAEQDRDGLLLQAHGGTLFLDGVEDMHEALQAKLLRVLEDRTVRPLGGKDAMQVDVAVVCSARGRLDRLVERGKFRHDLYYRLRGAVQEISSLRERREDVLPLAHIFLDQYARESEVEPPELTRDAQIKLVKHSWPGNVRELENEMRRMVALKRRLVTAKQLSESLGAGGAANSPYAVGAVLSLDEAVSRTEREVLVEALKKAGGNKSQASQLLGITRKSLYRRLNKHGLR